MTAPLDRAEINRLLRENGTGVLALTDGTETYGVPQSFGYDGNAIYYQLVYDEDSRKISYLETTETASHTVYTTDPARSVIATGPIERVPAADETTAATAIAENATVPTLDVHPEKRPDALTFEFYRLVLHDVSGRRFGAGAAPQPAP